jgi:hypothetical protein
MRLGYFLVAGIGIYIAVSVYLTIFPKTTIISRKLTQYYEWFALPGPFFREDRIRYVPQFHFRYKEKNGTWSESRDVERENFLNYHASYFNYPDLRRSRYERFLARALWNRTRAKKKGDLLKSAELRELNAYLKKNYLPEDIDSIDIEYKWKDARKDTTALPGFHFVYKSF